MQCSRWKPADLYGGEQHAPCLYAAAMDPIQYLQTHKVPQLLDDLVADLLQSQPADVAAHIAAYATQLQLGLSASGQPHLHTFLDQRVPDAALRDVFLALAQSCRHATRAAPRCRPHATALALWFPVGLSVRGFFKGQAFVIFKESSGPPPPKLPTASVASWR